MRVVIDGRYASPRFPGVGRYTASLVRALADAGPDRLIVLTEGTSQPFAGPNITAVEVAAQVRSVREQWMIPHAVSGLGATLYHAPFYVWPYAVRAPSVVTVYDLIPVLVPGALPSPRARLAFMLAMRLTLLRARRIITVSRSTRDDLVRRYRVSLDRIKVTPAGLDPRFRPAAGAAVARVRERYGLREAYVLHVGINKPHKNLRRLVEAYARCAASRPERLVLAGPEDPRYADVREAVRYHGLEGRVSMLGWVDEADLPALYTGATACVLPSLHEGFGLPVLEAMGCGTPVLCSATSSFPEVAGDAALTFDPCDAGAMADVMLQALGNRALRDRMRERGLVRAAGRTWAETARATWEIYREATS